MEWFVWSFRWIVILSTATVGSWWSQWVVMAIVYGYSWWRWRFSLEWVTHIRLWPLLSGSMVFRIWTCIVGGYGLKQCVEFVWFSIFDIVANWWRALLSLGNQCLKMWCVWGGDWSTIKFSQICLFKKYEKQNLKHAYTFFCYLLEPSVEMWWCLKIFLTEFFKHCFSQKVVEFATISSWIFSTLWHIAHKWPFPFWATS